MSGITGARLLTRFALRRDRVRLAVWVLGIVALVLITASSTQALFPTQADLDKAAAVGETNAAAIAFNGPPVGLETMGGQVAFQMGGTTLVLVGLMSVFMTGRLTRAEEESGRIELLRATIVGRHAPTVVALAVVGAMNLAVAALVAAGLAGLGLPATGSVVMGASLVALGLAFTGVTLVAAQVSENTRVVYGASGAVLALAFILRAVGDVGSGTVSWLSPIGWAQKAQPYAGDRWWPLLLPLAATVVLVALAVFLAAHRDVGAGLLPPRPGVPEASGLLGRPVGLAVRLQRGSLLGWVVAVVVVGVAYGAIAKDIDRFVAGNEALREMLAGLGGLDLTQAYLGTSLLVLAVIGGGGAAVQTTLRLHSEETAGRVEELLATPVSRYRWVAGHLVTAVVGTAAVLAAGGLAVGLTYGLAAGDLGQVPRLLGAALVYAPAAWLLVGLTVALFGLVPRAALVPWVVLIGAMVVGMLADLLKLPSWVRDLSPFQHVPRLPGAELTVLPLLVLTVLAVGLMAAGLVGFRRRDLR